MRNIVILSGGAANGLVTALAPAFEAAEGCKIGGSFGAVGAMRDKLKAGEPADLLILTRALIDALAGEGLALSGTVRDVGDVQTAVAVRSAAATAPDVSSEDALRAALEAADEVYFPDPALATAGIHVARVIRDLGLEEALARRIRVHPNGATAMRHLAASSAPNAVGITQVTEILAAPGVTLVAPLPGRMALTTTYTAAVTARANEPDVARRLLDRLTAAETAEQRRAAGFS